MDAINNYLKDVIKKYEDIQKWKIENNYSNLLFEDYGTPTDYEDWINEFTKFCIEINHR